ncbi:hypothetical protein EDD22DRAFT_1001947 [Suillus occidentalis]|nr:hypothetical protein EDD22DRAFT_1001947 [Suillus occidentalis]
MGYEAALRTLATQGANLVTLHETSSSTPILRLMSPLVDHHRDLRQKNLLQSYLSSFSATVTRSAASSGMDLFFASIPSCVICDTENRSLLTFRSSNASPVFSVEIRASYEADRMLGSGEMRYPIVEMNLLACEDQDGALPDPPGAYKASISQDADRSPTLACMLDPTMRCTLITDELEAVDGIISHAPKIRNLVLSKCIQLTDRTVENICVPSKHLHYLHLGHAANDITDRLIKTLARCCTRLRYVDFANCVLLTDTSVFELSSLPKLRRIGSVLILLQEFNMSQMMTFCVYSGSGVAKLRSFSTDLFHTITEDMNADDDEMEYDDDVDEGLVEGADMEGGMDGDVDEDITSTICLSQLYPPSACFITQKSSLLSRSTPSLRCSVI